MHLLLSNALLTLKSPHSSTSMRWRLFHTCIDHLQSECFFPIFVRVLSQQSVRMEPTNHLLIAIYKSQSMQLFINEDKSIDTNMNRKGRVEERIVVVATFQMR